MKRRAAKGRVLNSIDLFAGCGGLSLGLEQAGFQCAFVNELNADALETFLRNRDKSNPALRRKFNVSDVKELVINDNLRADLKAGFLSHYGIDCDSGDLDLLAGGPPCQGYSGIGHRRSYSVDKKQLPSNHLYQDMAFLVNDFRPKIFLFENVKGLLSAKWTKDGTAGEIWDDVCQTFQSLEEYEVRFRLVYAKDYGVPQNRPRVLLVGLRKDLPFKSVRLSSEDALESGFLPKPTTAAPNLIQLLGDLVDPHYVNGGRTSRYPLPATTPIQRYFRTDPTSTKTFGKGTIVTEHDYSNHAPHVVEKFSYMLANGGRIPNHLKTKKFAQRLLPKVWGKEGPTITATSLPDDYVHFSQPRILSVREWARLQMFPDWYQFAGKRTTGGLRRAGNPRQGIHDREVPKYTQIGNAVPVALARAVGHHFAKLLQEL